MKERIKDNKEKIKMNKQLPYLVGNVVEVKVDAVFPKGYSSTSPFYSCCIAAGH
jgi:ATP-dependent 26S proteasome regulatory subunit